MMCVLPVQRMQLNIVLLAFQYKDFLVIGTPMQLVLWVLSIVFLTMDQGNWWISWLATFLALMLVVMVQICGVSFSSLMFARANNEDKDAPTHGDNH